MKHLYAIALLAVCFALPAKSQSDIATIHFYAPDKFGVRHLPLYVDEKTVGSLHGRDMIDVPTTPGKHTVHSSQKDSGIFLEVTAGGDYYVKVSLSEHGFPPPGRVDLVDPSQGKYELEKMKKH
jgi:hypothetical protein